MNIKQFITDHKKDIIRYGVIAGAVATGGVALAVIAAKKKSEQGAVEGELDLHVETSTEEQAD